MFNKLGVLTLLIVGSAALKLNNSVGDISDNQKKLFASIKTEKYAHKPSKTVIQIYD